MPTDKDIAISVQGLSKSYTIAHQSSRYATAREALMHRVLHPFEKPERETFWALKDVSFDIPKGEVVGIIGRNGAGKSTLLKILSRITEPTQGRAILHGRVGSLLEVGTGFHPELTGRENIYLNGAVLGMSRREIDKQFDAIVDFAEVEQFLDTPVKRYSSGMYVRLAFSVAAHLDTDILFVDEVLAVGDTEFQKKCLGRMGEVAQEGRTVLFVSHNMAAIRTMCARCVLLSEGSVALDSNTDIAINQYLSEADLAGAVKLWSSEEAPQASEIRFHEACILNADGVISSSIDCRAGFSILVKYELMVPLRQLRIGFFMRNAEGIAICGSNDPIAWPHTIRPPGLYVSRCDFPGYTLNSGLYSVYFGADVAPFTHALVTTPYCLRFSIEDTEGHGPRNEKLPGILRPKLEWHVHQVARK